MSQSTLFTSLSGECSGRTDNTVLSTAAVIGKPLTGFNAVAGTVSSTDSILQAIQKLTGNVNAISTISRGLLTSTIVNPVTDRTFNLSSTPITNGEDVILNGLVLLLGAGNDYTISGATVTINGSVTLLAGDQVVIKFLHT